jgi:hypothetical protein
MVLAFAGDSTITRFLVISRKLIKTVKTGAKVKQLTIQNLFCPYRLSKRKEFQLILFYPGTTYK